MMLVDSTNINNLCCNPVGLKKIGKASKNCFFKPGLRTCFFENSPGFFFVTLLLEIPDKTRLHPEKLVLHPLEILRPKTKTPENSMLFLIKPLVNPLAIFQIPLEIPYP